MGSNPIGSTKQKNLTLVAGERIPNHFPMIFAYLAHVSVCCGVASSQRVRRTCDSACQGEMCINLAFKELQMEGFQGAGEVIRDGKDYMLVFKELADKAGLQEGDQVAITFEEGIKSN